MIITFKLNEEGKGFNTIDFSNKDNIVFVVTVAKILLVVNNIIQ